MCLKHITAPVTPGRLQRQGGPSDERPAASAGKNPEKIPTAYLAGFVNAVSSKVHGFSENPLGYFNIQGVTKSG